MFDREAETDSAERALEPGPVTDREEAVRALKWIKDFCEAHHAGEPSGVHLHRLLVDIPHYLDYVIATLESSSSDRAQG